MQTKQVKRTNVTIDDRRLVIAIARGRRPADVAKEGHEQFIKNALKDRLNWPRKEQASDAIKAAAKQMAAFLKKVDVEADIARKAKIAAMAKKETQEA
jgi:hypothetical protein